MGASRPRRSTPDLFQNGDLTCGGQLYMLEPFNPDVAAMESIVMGAGSMAQPGACPNTSDVHAHVIHVPYFSWKMVRVHGFLKTGALVETVTLQILRT